MGIPKELCDRDPDYVSAISNNQTQQNIYEENARNVTARKITEIVEKEFSLEIDLKEKELLKIQELLHKAFKIFHLLRYVIVNNFYNRKQCQVSQTTETVKQNRIHPAVKSLLSKSSKLNLRDLNDTDFAVPSTSTDPRFLCNDESFKSNIKITSDNMLIKIEENNETLKGKKRPLPNKEDSPLRKVPRYVPPKSSVSENACPPRGNSHKIRKRIRVGNISKWIRTPYWQKDKYSHKWMVYVNSEKDDINTFVSKVRFFLHSTYYPNDVIEITRYPFELVRRGWGEFPIRVQLHFKNSQNKPVDLIHNLKLDRSYTELYMLGSESSFDVWISTTESHNPEQNSDNKFIESSTNNIKIESNFTSECKQTEESEETSTLCTFEKVQVKQEIINNSEVCKSDSTLIEKSEDIKVKVESPYMTTNQENDFCLTLSEIRRNIEFDHTYANISHHQLNSMQNAIDPSKSNSPIKPLQITIPPMNILTASNKHVLLLKDNKSIPVTSIFPTKSNKLIDDNAKISIAKNSNKINVHIPQGRSILKKLPNANINRQQEATVNNIKKTAVLTLKAANSVLLNVNEDVPILKIADPSKSQYNYNLTTNTVRHLNPQSNINKQESYASLEKSIVQRPKITLGKDKFKIQSKRDLYETILQTIDTVNIINTEALIRYVIRRLPIVTSDAFDSEYRQLHPYACRSEEEFFTYNIGKQRALEWCRAKMIQYFLQRKSIPADQLWSVKEIIVWARLHGYTPVRSNINMLKATMNNTAKLPDISTSTSMIVTCTEPVALQKWLQISQQKSSHQLMDYDTEEINIEDIEDVRITIDRRKKDHIRNYLSTLIPLELDKSLLPFHNFICDTAQNIGIKIGSEEIIPGVLYCAASRVIMRVIECFVEDLIRSSLAKAWERNSGDECPKIITLNDVHSALTSREEFDIFTNEGLGSIQQLNATDSSNL